MSTDTAPRLKDREPQVIVRDTAYVAAALADDAITRVHTLTDRLEELRADAPAKAKELRETGPQKLRTLPEETQAALEARIAELREKANTAADERIAQFEAQFDAKAATGAERVSALREDERVVRVRTVLEPVVDQLKIARSQVKGAATSIRRTVDVAVEAGREQAENARSQVKAAATSTRRTVDTAVEAGKDLAS